MGKEQNEPDDVLRQHMRYEMPPRHSHPRVPVLPRCQNIGLCAQLHDLCTDDAGQARPVGSDNTNGHTHDAAAHHDRDHENEQDMRNSHTEIHEPEYKLIDLAAECSRERSKEECNTGADKRRSNSNLQTNGHPLNRAQEHIAPHIVRPERMDSGRSKIFLPIVNCVRALRHRCSPDEYPEDKAARQNSKDHLPLTNAHAAAQGILFHQESPLPSRSCGSTIPYRILAMRFPTKTNTALKIAMPSRSARSPRNPAIVTVLPSPG